MDTSEAFHGEKMCLIKLQKDIVETGRISAVFAQYDRRPVQ